MKLALTDFGGHDAAPVLIVGPSLGTSVSALWKPCAEQLARHHRVLGFDLPGHGNSIPDAAFGVADIAQALVDGLAELGIRRFHYAGDSLGGAVGLQLLVDHPDVTLSATLISTGARIGTPTAWRERADLVRASGVNALLAATPQRWFAPGFTDREPVRASALLDSLHVTDAESYASCCDALAEFDVRPLLAGIAQPVLAIAGTADVPTPPSSLRHIATGVEHGTLLVLDDAAHLPPAEQPDQVAAAIAEHIARPAPSPRPDPRMAGMKVRREVLGDDHVDRATATATDFTGDFQEFITRYAWGEIWTRPGLDRRSRSIVTMTALIARGHHEEFAMHVRAALRNGLTREEIKEVIMACAIYCGVPDANTAFRIAQQVFDDNES